MTDRSGIAMSRCLAITCVLTFVAMAFSALAKERIVFSRVAPPEATLFVSNADGSNQRGLTGRGSLDYDPAWSPKGDWIAFTSERAGSADIYRVHPDGSGLERLVDSPAYDDQAAFSPDEKALAFVSTRASGLAKLWTLQIRSRKATRLTSGNGGDFRPAWSPDGKWIAFSSDRESNFRPGKGHFERLHVVHLYIIRPDGTGLRRISGTENGNGSSCGGPKWTRDSRSVIAYCMDAEDTLLFRMGKLEGGTRLLQIDTASGKTQEIDAGPGVKVSPSALISGEVAFVRLDTPGVFYGNGKPGPVGDDISSPSWSPDGTQVVYSRSSADTPPEARKVWRRNPGYELGTTLFFLPAFDPTGVRFAVTEVKPGSAMSLTIVEDGAPNRSILIKKDTILAPQWSPDGKQIAFGIGDFSQFHVFPPSKSQAANPAQVGIINTDGSGFHLATEGPNNNAFPSFAPDGKRIVYRTTGPDGDGLRILDFTSHTVVALTKDHDNFPAWSPRGDLIAFVRRIGDDFEILTIAPDGSNLKQLTHTKGNDAHASWSPDGQRLAFTSSRMGFRDEAINSGSPQPYGDIFVMRYDGTHVEQLTDNQWEEGGEAWQPHPPKR